MKTISPRTIIGNRGDLLSRYGILEALHRHTGVAPTVFAQSPRDLGPLPFATVPFGPLYNFWPRFAGLSALRCADGVAWAGGLDLQDDSSLLKLMHTWMTFLSYRLLGKRINVLMQGAGPLNSRMGRWLTRRILNLVDSFVVRDTGTLQLLLKIGGRARLIKGHDGIFLDGLSRLHGESAEGPLIERLTRRAPGRPLVGLNLRLWFHFSSGVLPYQFAKSRYLERAQAPMKKLIDAARTLVQQLRTHRHARIVLLSMYEPNSLPWEDDLPYLQQVKDAFADDDEVAILNEPLGIGGFCDVMRRLNLMIGVRLHSTLIALRFGVPAINLAYTNKCGDILNDLGLPDHHVPLNAFIDDPDIVYTRACSALDDPLLCSRIQALVVHKVSENEHILRNLYSAASRQMLAA